MTVAAETLPQVKSISAFSGPSANPARALPSVAGPILMTAILLGFYYWQRTVLRGWLGSLIQSVTGYSVEPTDAGVLVVAVWIVALVLIWRKILAKDKRFHAPLLITSILVMGDAAFSILENHPSHWLAGLTSGAISSYSPTFIAIATTVSTELILGRFFYGKWPHLASAYVSGISAGILVKSPELWPFIFCGMISITSKYAFRIGDRHLWNPTNFGMTVMLFLAPQHMASLSVQAGNEIWAAVVIWILGGLILWSLRRLYIPIAFLLAFVPLSIMRSLATGHPWLTELTPMTSPMFQLYIFFMITDPKTTVRSKRGQISVAVCVAIMETVYRLAFHDVHSLYHALFTVGPVANVIEIFYFPRPKTTAVKEPTDRKWVAGNK